FHVLEVRRRKAQLAAATVSTHDPPLQAMGPSQQAPSEREIRSVDRPANATAGNHLRVDREQLRGPHQEAELLAEVLERLQVSSSLPAEAEVPSHDDLSRR